MKICNGNPATECQLLIAPDAPCVVALHVKLTQSNDSVPAGETNAFKKYLYTSL